MSVELSHGNGACEAQAVEEFSREGFAAAVKEYAAGKTEPHRHDYDICLHILEGEFRLGVGEEGIVQRFAPGDRLVVPAGTLHFEEHGPLTMVVGRRDRQEGSHPVR
jgi:quercetin dioxygenase-like cupin family protein